jgi:glycosyltransferase involved in cell wall biosynthesis
MTLKNPRVSICIPVYNRAHMVRPTIESALSQTFVDLEIIVVDDASTDDIENVVASYTDPRLQFIKNPKNLGQFENFNRCIEVSRGEFLHILHSDDYVDPHFTETCVRFFDKNPDIYLTFTSEVKKSLHYIEKVDFSDKNEILSAPEGFLKLLQLGCYIPCASVMTRKSVYNIVGGYSREYPIAADYYQWLKIARIFDIGFVKNATVFYCEGVHSESYRFFISSPLGYLDRVKIILQTISDIKDDYYKFLPEINHQLYVLTFKYLITAFIWRDTNKIYPPSIFIGLAHFSRSLIKPQSILEHVSKILINLLIIAANVLIIIPPLRMVIKRIILPFTKKNLYMKENWE